MKKPLLELAIGIAITLALGGCNQSETKNSNSFPVGTTMEDLKAQSAKIAALQEKQEIEKAAKKTENEKLEAERDRWNYSIDTDKMTENETKTASISSENSFNFAFPYAGENYGNLLIRQRVKGDLSVMFYVSKGQIICMPSCSVKVRFDNKPLMRFSANLPADYSSDTIFLSPASKFLAELKKSKRVFVQATYYAEGSQVSEFKTERFIWEGNTGK